MFVSLIVAGTALAAEPLVVEIWPGKVPEESGGIGAERARMSPKLDRKQVEVTEPTRMITDTGPVPTPAGILALTCITPEIEPGASPA